MFSAIFITWLFIARNIQSAATDIEDTVSSGNYQIHLCNSGLPDSHASYLQVLLPQIYTNLQAVITDAQLGTASKRGYGAFFKTNDSIGQVIEMYQKMADGADILVPSVPGDSKPGMSLEKPSFFCVNEDVAGVLAYDQCLKENPNFPLVYWEDSEDIVLCPLFWQHQETAVSRIDCPRLRGNTLSPNNDQLSTNQQALIVHGLVHLYQNITKSPSDVLNIQDAVNLDAKASLVNANNYALYYAGQ